MMYLHWIRIMPKHFFHSFSVTSAAVPGVLSAIGSGVGGGLSQAISAAQKAGAVLSENNGQRDSLLRSLKALFEDQPALDHSVFETYLAELQEGLIASNDSLAFVFRNVLLGVVSAVTHVSQMPIDASTIVKQTGNGLSDLEIPKDKVRAASKKASTFDLEVKGSSASVRSVCDFVGEHGGKIMEKVHDDIHVADNSHAASQARTAASVAGSSIATTAAIPTALALGTDIVGHVVKEVSAIRHFSAQESANKANADNVYGASAGVAKASQNGDSQASKLQSKNLEQALSAMKPVKDLMVEQKVTSPLTTALLRLIVLASFVESSRGINKTAIAVAEGRIQKALAKATDQGPSAGVDRINSIHSNLSSLSNIMRLCAENLGNSPAVKVAAQSSELVSSRAMSVALSHISELAKALRQLVNPQPENGENKSSSITTNSSVEVANPRILDQSEATIKEVLDRIEKANELHVIPELNQDLAGQLNASAHSGIASLLMTHSLFSNPSILATKGVKAAVKTNDAQKNEALMETLPSVTQALNAIQASTRNMMAEMEKHMASDASKVDGSLLSTHKSMASGTATTFWAVSALLLFADEMLSICRSFTLIDQQRLHAASQKISAVPTKDASAQSAEQIAWDSHLQQEHSATHAMTALRLTLSHTGISLMKIALALHHALDGNIDTVQENIKMHALQQTLLESTAYASRYIAEGLLLSTGGASAVSVALNGSANWSQQKVHTTDAHLHPAQTHGSEESCGSCTDSLQPTGFSTDVVAGTVTNILKVLAQGGLIGLDTTIKLIKVLEIISLHRDPHIALRLESNGSANPNGISKNALLAPSVASGVGAKAILINMLDALQSLDKSCGSRSTLNAQNRLKEVIDQQIEEFAVLNDDEAARNNKQGLKEFYKIVIRLLAPNNEASAYDRLVKRLDFGGISLASYHSLFGAYDERPVADLRFVSTFANEDDAHGVLRRFIDQCKEKYSLLKSLHDELPEEQRSKKAQIMYEHVFEEIFQHYKQVKMADIAQHGSIRRKIPTRETFQIDIGLVQVELPLQIPQPPVDVVEENAPGQRM